MRDNPVSEAEKSVIWRSGRQTRWSWTQMRKRMQMRRQSMQEPGRTAPTRCDSDWGPEHRETHTAWDEGLPDRVSHPQGLTRAWSTLLSWNEICFYRKRHGFGDLSKVLRGDLAQIKGAQVLYRQLLPLAGHQPLQRWGHWTAGTWDQAKRHRGDVNGSGESWTVSWSVSRSDHDAWIDLCFSNENGGDAYEEKLTENVVESESGIDVGQRKHGDSGSGNDGNGGTGKRSDENGVNQAGLEAAMREHPGVWEIESGQPGLSVWHLCLQSGHDRTESHHPSGHQSGTCEESDHQTDVGPGNGDEMTPSESASVVDLREEHPRESKYQSDPAHDDPSADAGEENDHDQTTSMRSLSGEEEIVPEQTAQEDVGQLESDGLSEQTALHICGHVPVSPLPADELEATVTGGQGERESSPVPGGNTSEQSARTGQTAHSRVADGQAAWTYLENEQSCWKTWGPNGKNHPTKWATDGRIGVEFAEALRSESKVDGFSLPKVEEEAELDGGQRSDVRATLLVIRRDDDSEK
ncbi:hypothetical protein FB446DRAFT_703767 [Lentinula raphanica]|nr:hypothetical protein FB446DRAFT_703767 [Lentinula raphanica]